MRHAFFSLVMAFSLAAGLVACSSSNSGNTSSGSDTGPFEELVEAMGGVFIDPEAAESSYLLQEACLMEVLVNDGLTTWDWAINYYQSNYKTKVDWNDNGYFPPENILDDNPDYDWDQFLGKALPCFEEQLSPLASDSSDQGAQDKGDSGRQSLIETILNLGLEEDTEVIECIVDLVADLSGLSYSEIEEMIITQSPELDLYIERVERD